MWALLPIAILTYPHVDPVIVRVGPTAVRWYGLAYVLGFAAAYGLLRLMVARGRLRMSRDDLDALIGWVMLGVIAGGRLGWWLVYHRRPAAGAEPWWEPVAIWHGGMSFHGGLVGVIVAMAMFARRRGLVFWNVADALARVAPVGLFFGRVANFINAELVGRPTRVPWGMVFPGDTVARHPSQLYEAVLEGPVLMLCVWLSARRKGRDGRAAAAALVTWYGVARFLVEFTREPDAQVGYVAFGWLTMGQVLSAGMVAVGAGLWWWVAGDGMIREDASE